MCGKFKFMPKTECMKDFPSNSDNLTEISVSNWRQFIFTSINPEYRFEELIKDLEDRIGWMPIEDFILREDLSKEYYVKANWALYCDNYLSLIHI